VHGARLVTTAAAFAAAVCAAAAGAGATTMHPVLGAKLAGMGEKGVVNLQSHAVGGQLCWTFTLSGSGLTGASIRDSAGMTVAKLGSMYEEKGCTMVAKMALDEIETKPASYHVWVATKNHPGDLRGTLFVGMAHTTHM
jgi:hypothetical protein